MTDDIPPPSSLPGLGHLVGTIHLRNLGGRIDTAAYYAIPTLLRARQIVVAGTLYEQEGEIGGFWVYKAIEVSGAPQTAEIQGVVETPESPIVISWLQIDQWFADHFAHGSTEPVAMSRVKDLYSLLQRLRPEAPRE